MVSALPFCASFEAKAPGAVQNPTPRKNLPRTAFALPRQRPSRPLAAFPARSPLLGDLPDPPEGRTKVPAACTTNNSRARGPPPRRQPRPTAGFRIRLLSPHHRILNDAAATLPSAGRSGEGGGKNWGGWRGERRCRLLSPQQKRIFITSPARQATPSRRRRTATAPQRRPSCSRLPTPPPCSPPPLPRYYCRILIFSFLRRIAASIPPPPTRQEFFKKQEKPHLCERRNKSSPARQLHPGLFSSFLHAWLPMNEKGRGKKNPPTPTLPVAIPEINANASPCATRSETEMRSPSSFLQTVTLNKKKMRGDDFFPLPTPMHTRHLCSCLLTSWRWRGKGGGEEREENSSS